MTTYEVPPHLLRPQPRPPEDTWFFSSLAILLVAALVVMIFVPDAFTSRVLVNIQLALWVLLLIEGVVGGMAMASRSGTRKYHERLREFARYELTSGALIRHLPGEADVIIRFGEITRVAEIGDWLSVSASTGWRIQVPKDVEGYDDLRNTLSRAKPVEQVPSASGYSIVSIAAAVLIVSAITIMTLTHEHSVRLWSGYVLIVALTWQYVCFPIFGALTRKKTLKSRSAQAHL